MIKIMIVEDHALIRTALTNMLNNADGIRVVAEAAAGIEARRLARRHKLDIVLLDLFMPGEGGLETLRRLKREQPRLKVIGLSICKDGPLPGRFLEAGANGYLSKDASKDEMIWAIRRVDAGQGHISTEVATHIVIDEEALWETLTDRELEVMRLLSSGRDVDEIAKILSIAAKTVNTHRRKLLKKLKVKNDVQLAMLAKQYHVFESMS
jgi:two-component system invasion response regulator UvrY